MTQEELEKTKAKLRLHLQNLDEKYGNQTYGGKLAFIAGYITSNTGLGDERTYTEAQLKEFFNLAERNYAKKEQTL